MKMKLKAVAVAVLVLALQLFSAFIPCMAAAAGETSTEQKVVPFSNTTIYADLVDPGIYAEGKTPGEISAGETAAAATLLQKYPKISAKGTDDVQIIASVVEESSSGYSAFFYVYIPGGTMSALSAAFTIDAGGRTLYKSAKQLDETATLIKYRVPLTKGEYSACKNGDSYELTVSLFKITYSTGGSGTSGTKTVTYSPLQQNLSGGVVTSDIFFSYDASGMLQRSTIAETVALDVHMACERYSQTNAALWYQMNTAYFVVPKEYADQYKRVFSIDYKYRLLSDVPMLVSDDKEFMEKLEEYEQIDFSLQTFDWSTFPFERAIFNKITGNEVNIGPYFRFFVDDISTTEGARYDVLEDEIWDEYNRAYEFAKKLYYGDAKALYVYVFGKPAVGFSFDYSTWQQQYHALTSFEYFFITDVLKLPYDLYTPSTFDTRTVEKLISSGDSAASENWWDRLMDGRRLFDSIEDDSVSKVPAIQEADVTSVKSMTDAAISETYCINERYISELRGVLAEASAGDTIVFFHCIETYYYSWPPDYIFLFDWFDSEVMLESQGYFVLNTFILDFNVINLHYNKGEITVPVVHPSVNFVGGLESPDSIGDGIIDPPDMSNVWDAIQKLFNVIRIIVLVLVFVVITIVVLRVIGLVRDAFGRRGRGR